MLNLNHENLKPEILSHARKAYAETGDATYMHKLYVFGDRSGYVGCGIGENLSDALDDLADSGKLDYCEVETFNAMEDEYNYIAGNHGGSYDLSEFWFTEISPA